MKKLNLDIQRFSSTNKTTNYELPQFIGTDKPTWLGDFNEAMSAIDSGMHENATDISSMASDVASASASASQASQDVTALTSTVNTLSGNVTAVTTTANNAQSTATSALNTANTANGKADTNASAISTINSSISTMQTNISNITGSVLWSNSSPDSDFGYQNITLSSGDYDLLEWIFRSDAGAGATFSIRILKGYSVRANELSLVAPTKRWSRKVNYVSDTEYNIFDCTQLEQGQSSTTVNSQCVPLYVIGYKTNLFS